MYKIIFTFAQGMSGETALIVAAFQGHIQSPMLLAAFKGYTAIVDTLLAKGHMAVVQELERVEKANR